MKGIQARIKAILDEATGQDLNSWEKNFLRTLKDRGNTTVSERQEACLKKIEDKLKLQEDMDMFSCLIDGMIKKPLTYQKEGVKLIVPIHYLRAIRNTDKINVANLAKDTNTGRTISREMIRKLHAEGLLVEAPDYVRGMERVLYLTPNGETYLNNVLGAKEENHR